jgi:hypothetical protein
LTFQFVLSLVDDLDERVLILSHLLHSMSASESIQLIKDLLSNEPTLKYFFEHDEDSDLIERLCSSIDREIVLLLHEGEGED